MDAKPTKSRRIGLLPLYLALYDELIPDLRGAFDGFMDEIAAGFEARGIEVARTAVCRLAPEFKAAVGQFEAGGVDAIVTLHLAYSPSLEAIDALSGTALPIIMLDTTMDAAYGVDVPAERLMYNHGIHGVMDLANMLRRRRKPYRIVAGHYRDPSLLERVAEMVRTAGKPDVSPVGNRPGLRPAVPVPSAPATMPLRNARFVRIGEAFAGMGDFIVEPALLRERFGITVEQVGLESLEKAVAVVTEDAIRAEVADDRARFSCDLEDQVHRQSVRVGLGLRHLLDAGGYQGFSINFQSFDQRERAANLMPFLEISKAMARGIGYAGEGDLLTAMLVHALARTFDAVTFTEIFCPDWAGNSLFLSHMGEISPAVAGERPVICAKPAFDGKSATTAVLTCAVKPGPAVFVNLAPGPDDRFALLVTPVEVLAENGGLDPAMRAMVRAWIRPACPVGEFLEAYSYAGGTHHSALVLGDHAEAVKAFGRTLGVDVIGIG